MNTTFKCLIAGLGNIGMGYDLDYPEDSAMTHVGACIKHNAVSEVFGLDPDGKKRDAFRSLTGTTAFADFDECRASVTDIDIAIISTPSNIRLDVLKKCLSLSPQAVLLEKPLATNNDEARAIMETLGDTPAYVNYIRLFDPALMRIGHEIIKDQYGPLLSGTCHFSGDTLNIASHYISLVLEWFGKPLDATPLENQNTFALKYKNSDIIFKSVSPAPDYALGEMELFFPKHKIVINDACTEIAVAESIPDPTFPTYKKLAPPSSVQYKFDILNYQYNVLDTIIKNIQTNTRLLADKSLKNALDTLNICEAVTGNRCATGAGNRTFDNSGR